MCVCVCVCVCVCSQTPVNEQKIWYLDEDRSEKTVRRGRETRAGMEGRVQEEMLGCGTSGALKIS